MIYFIQRADEQITFGLTSDVEETKTRLSRQYGGLQVLGVMAGAEHEYEELIKKFATFKVFGTEEWYLSVTELHDFIDENATLEVTAVKPSARYKTSDYTPIKQQALSDALRQQINMIVHFTKSWQGVEPYLYLDLNAGPGISQDLQPGSPIIFDRIANDYMREWDNFRFHGYLYEPDVLTFANLKNTLGSNTRFTLFQESHEILLEQLKQPQRHFASTKPKGTYGTVYADPSNAALPWHLLEKLNQVYPRVDIMINIACASYKRTIASIGYQTLAQRLPRIKEHWIVRKPYGHHQWSILIGTNWKRYPSWKSKGFYPWNDGDIGTSIFEKLVYTPEQLQQKRQLPLWSPSDFE